MSHVTKQMTTNKGELADIDLGIAELIQLLWDLGLETKYCCEGDDEDGTRDGVSDAYIYFPRAEDAMRFGRMIRLCGSAEIADWSRGYRNSSSAFFQLGERERLAAEGRHDEIAAKQAVIDEQEARRRNYWEYSVDFFDDNYRCSIYFPKKQIAEMVEALKKAKTHGLGLI